MWKFRRVQAIVGLQAIENSNANERTDDANLSMFHAVSWSSGGWSRECLWALAILQERPTRGESSRSAIAGAYDTCIVGRF